MDAGQPAPLIAEDVYEIVMANKDRLNSAIIYDRDFEVRREPPRDKDIDIRQTHMHAADAAPPCVLSLPRLPLV